MLGPEKTEEYTLILEEIRLYSYREAEEIWGLIPPEQWESYESMGITDQREQLLLEAALIILRKDFTKKVIQHDQEEDWEDAAQKAIAGVTGNESANGSGS